MSRQIDMVAMDFDLTLVDYIDIEYPPSGAHIDPATITFLIDLIGQGVEVGIVTGRDFWTACDILTLAGVRFGKPFPSFLITRENNIHWLKDGQGSEHEVWNQLINNKLAHFTQHISIYIDVWLKKLTEHGLIPRKWNLCSDFGLEIYFNTDEQAACACSVLQPWIDEIPDMHIHRNRMMANLVHKESGKGAALQQASRAKGIDNGRVLAIGDSLNDLSMVDGSFGFLSGTVDNADPIIKKAVRNNHGVVADRRVSYGLLDVVTLFTQKS